jgi:uncharacterized LabA/DUF88 family protein
MKLRTYVYVDAFNLYYGCLKGTPYRWLNMEELCRRMLSSDNEVQRIKYFTARVGARPDPGQPARQQAYLRALHTLPCIEIHYGHFLTHEVTMPVVVAPGARQTYARVIKTQEKGSDVNMATHLMADAYGSKFDLAVLVTGDSDLLAPVQHLHQHMRRRVGVLNPQSRPCVVLQQAATFYKQIREGVLRDSQFPDQMKDSNGDFHRPPKWK